MSQTSDTLSTPAFSEEQTRPGGTDVAIAAGLLGTLVETVDQVVLERHEMLELIARCWVAEQHFLLLGTPGEGKTMGVEEMVPRVEGISFAAYELQPGHTPEYLVGPMDTVQFIEHARWVFNTSGQLPDVEYAFIDEVFKGNAMVRAAVLSVLGPRNFKNGGKIIPCPMRSCGTASNELPDLAIEAAFYDRLLARHEVEPIQDPGLRRQAIEASLARDRHAAKTAVLDVDQLRLLQAARKRVRLGDEAAEAQEDLRRHLLQEGFRLSTRRWTDTFHLAAARALLAGRDEIRPSDLLVFCDTAWARPEDRPLVRSTVIKVVAPGEGRTLEIADAIKDRWRQLKELQAQRGTPVDVLIEKITEFTTQAQAAEREVNDIADRLVSQQEPATTQRLTLEMIRRYKQQAAELILAS